MPVMKRLFADKYRRNPSYLPQHNISYDEGNRRDVLFARACPQMRAAPTGAVWVPTSLYETSTCVAASVYRISTRVEASLVVIAVSVTDSVVKPPGVCVDWYNMLKYDSRVCVSVMVVTGLISPNLSLTGEDVAEVVTADRDDPPPELLDLNEICLAFFFAINERRNRFQCGVTTAGRCTSNA